VAPYWSAEEATEFAKDVAELTMDCQPWGERLPYSFSYWEASAWADAMAAAALTSALWTDSSQDWRFCLAAEDSRLKKDAVAAVERRERMVRCVSFIVKIWVMGLSSVC
jgi:hypothetical protein